MHHQKNSKSEAQPLQEEINFSTDREKKSARPFIVPGRRAKLHIPDWHCLSPVSLLDSLKYFPSALIKNGLSCQISQGNRITCVTGETLLN